MYIPRVIPCLLLRDDGLVKTIRFKNPKYVGDSFNTVRILNEKGIDELIFLDISATIDHRPPRLEFIRKITSECFMPLCYGGGITSPQEIEQILMAGVEKVALNTCVFQNPKLVTEASRLFGSQSIVVAIDFKRNLFGKYPVFSHGGRQQQKIELLNHAKAMADLGAGELLINSIDRDGTGQGYDLEAVKMVADAVDIPVIACGGAGQLSDFKQAFEAGASAVAAGSFFVFHGKHRAVLITYPSMDTLKTLFTAT